MITEYIKIQISLEGRTKCREQVNNFNESMKAYVSLYICVCFGIPVKHNNQLCISCAHIKTAFIKIHTYSEN
jgi:hypothetical protein